MKKPEIPKAPTVYPVGTFVHSEKGYFYISKHNSRQRILSERILASWAPPRIVETSESALAKYNIVSKMKFRNGTIVFCIADNCYYLIESTLRRKIVSPDLFHRLGTTRDKAMVVSKGELELHQQGEDIE